ncbi:MAG: YbaN family protein [Actinomycetota bacterium]|nr:YbaN family protein [Actinomycetota bacterium]
MIEGKSPVGDSQHQATRALSSGPARILWLFLGCISVGLGGIGIFLPGLPTTVFMIVGASCFARSSPRFERWILDLPVIGPAVHDYRSGLGMPRRAKKLAVTSIFLMCALSAGLLIDLLLVRALVVAVGLIGVWFVGWRVPTREQVLEARDQGQAFP